MQPNAPTQELTVALEERPPRHPAPFPGDSPMPPAGWEIEPDDQSIPLSHYLWVLRRQRWRILLGIAIPVIATLLISKRLTPIYESTATVDIDRQLPTGIIGQDATHSALNDADQFLATQIKLIQSDSVLRPVAERFHLGNFDGRNAPADGTGEAPVAMRDLKVIRPPNTYLLLIGYRSQDRHLAANVANAIARSYVEHTYDIRFRSSESLSIFMEKQLEELRAKMERSNTALAQFERELNVINPEEKTNILSARLLQLNTDYTSAESDRVKKEAAFKSVSSGTIESAQASSQGDALKALSERLVEAQARFSQTRTHFGENHPEYRKAATQVLQAQGQLDEARSNVMRRVEVEYREAASREGMLQKSVVQTKAEFDMLNARSFEYQTLKHEAEADRKLYDELITKIREAGINAGFQSNMVRIADNARPGRNPVFPNIPLNLELAFLFSAVISVGAAVLLDTLDTAIRDTEQVCRIAKAEVVGALPRVKFWKNRLVLAEQPALSIEDAALPARRPADDRMLQRFEEAISTLRNTILLGSFDRQIKSLMVTSSTPAEGKSTVAVHLALAHAHQKRRTLLIDCDLRRPSVDRKMGLKAAAGLSAVVLSGKPWREAVTAIPGNEYMYVLPTGAASRRAAALIGRVLPQILEEAADEYDLMIVDAPPALGFPEPIQIATAVDGVVVIALAGKTDRKALASVVATLKRLRANVVGVALNEITKDVGDGYYYHAYDSKYSRYYHLSGTA